MRQEYVLRWARGNEFHLVGKAILKKKKVEYGDYVHLISFCFRISHDKNLQMIFL